MKNTYIILFIFSLLLLGCSSTYTVKNFSSKDRFYRDFIRSADTKDLNITLLNDSLVQTTGGVIIKHDTLFTSTNVFPVNIIKTVSYKTEGGGGSLPLGILSGAVSGIIIAVLAGNAYQSKEMDITPITYYMLFPPLGAVIGGIVGWFIGWKTIYQFNP